MNSSCASGYTGSVPRDQPFTMTHHPWDTFTPGWESLGRDSKEHRAMLLVLTTAKCSFPSHMSHCWKLKQKEKSGWKCEGQLGTRPPLHP